MHISPLQEQLPNVCSWIDKILQQHRDVARPVTSFGFSRLPRYFEPSTLSRAHVVVLDSVPTPPLSALGLPQFSAFENMDADGITYKDVYFLKRQRAMVESLHFHELVHVVQWQLLGPERFILDYALGLAHKGYEDHPFEKMAYGLEDRFCRYETFNVERQVQDDLRHLVPSSLSQAWR